MSFHNSAYSFIRLLGAKQTNEIDHEYRIKELERLVDSLLERIERLENK